MLSSSRRSIFAALLIAGFCLTSQGIKNPDIREALQHGRCLMAVDNLMRNIPHKDARHPDFLSARR